jgi:hypothetical protein
MMVQCSGYKVKSGLEAIIKNEDTLERIHGYTKTERIINRAKEMLDLLTSDYVHFNIGHNGVFLTPDDHAFLKEHS